VLFCLYPVNPKMVIPEDSDSSNHILYYCTTVLPLRVLYSSWGVSIVLPKMQYTTFDFPIKSKSTPRDIENEHDDCQWKFGV
jgi:hypothetical protein